MTVVLALGLGRAVDDEMFSVEVPVPYCPSGSRTETRETRGPNWLLKLEVPGRSLCYEASLWYLLKRIGMSFL